MSEVGESETLRAREEISSGSAADLIEHTLNDLGTRATCTVSGHPAPRVVSSMPGRVRALRRIRPLVSASADGASRQQQASVNNSAGL